MNAIRELKAPTGIAELRSFFGLCNVLRRRVSTFTRPGVLLIAKPRKDRPITFELLKENDLKFMNMQTNVLI